MHALAVSHLAAHLERLQARHAPREGAGTASEAEARAVVRLAALEREASDPRDLPIGRLIERFRLEPAELDALLLAATPAVLPSLAQACGVVDGGLFTLARLGERVLPSIEARLSSRLFGEGCRLVAAGLLRSGADAPPQLPWASRPVFVPGHWLAFLDGRREVGAEAAGCTTRVVPSLTLAHLAIDPAVKRNVAWIVQRLHATVAPDDVVTGEAGLDYPTGAAILLGGAAGTGRTALSRAIAAELGVAMLCVDGDVLGASAGAVGVLTSLCEQAQFFEELLVIRQADRMLALAPRLSAMLRRTIQRRRVLVLLLAEDTGEPFRELDPVILFRQSLGEPKTEQRHDVWKLNLPRSIVAGDDVDFEALGHLPLSPLQIQKAVHLAARLDGASPEAPATVSHEQLLACGRRQVIKADQLTETTRVGLTLDHLVLEESTREQLVSVIEAAWYRRTVLDEWGFGELLHRGTGIACLFDGEPGTGKTLSAEIVAAHLGRALKRVAVGSVVDKYIGETEKNLARVFARTDPEREVLLFDEADALFAKRTEVTRSVDRYSNMEINALLQLVERHEGVVILTTNLKGADGPRLRAAHHVPCHVQPADCRHARRALVPPPAGARADRSRRRLRGAGAGVRSLRRGHQERRAPRGLPRRGARCTHRAIPARRLRPRPDPRLGSARPRALTGPATRAQKKGATPLGVAPR